MRSTVIGLVPQSKSLDREKRHPDIDDVAVRVQPFPVVIATCQIVAQASWQHVLRRIADADHAMFNRVAWARRQPHGGFTRLVGSHQMPQLVGRSAMMIGSSGQFGLIGGYRTTALREADSGGGWLTVRTRGLREARPDGTS